MIYNGDTGSSQFSILAEVDHNLTSQRHNVNDG